MMTWILSIAFLLVSFLAGVQDLWIDQPYDKVVAVVGFVVVAVLSSAAGVVALTHSAGVWIWSIWLESKSGYSWWLPWWWWWWRWLWKWACLLTPHMCLFDWNWSRSQGKHVRKRQISPRRASELNLWSHPALTHCPPMHLLNVSTPQGVPSDTEAARR